MIRRLIVSLDETDYKTVMDEVIERIDKRQLPDGNGNINGRVFAEIIRDLQEYRDLYDSDETRLVSFLSKIHAYLTDDDGVLFNPERSHVKISIETYTKIIDLIDMILKTK